MRAFLRFFYLVTALAVSSIVRAQTAADYAIQLEANVQTLPPKITLTWKKVAGTTAYTVSRRLPGTAAWTDIFTGTTGDSSYADATVAPDSAFEYRVTATGGAGGTGYLYAGLKAKAPHSRGTALVLVDSLLRDSCADGIAQLRSDLRADGYAVIIKIVKRTDSVTGVKALITAVYTTNPSLSTLYLLGHIPVPYSGNIYPDGHPDHQGAWPADNFYGDMNGIWTDASVSNTVASRPENDNIPGDRKWDQDLMPSEAELAVGRVDFANMPAFGKTEAQLMNGYLTRAHRYKVDSISVRRRGLIDDNFGAFNGEAFAANAWRAFGPLLSRDSIKSADFITTVDTTDYQWAYGCGGGSYTGAGGIGSTSDFTTKNVNAVFTMMFGSYFGDWDAQNSFLRAPLCSNVPALTSCWAGRPNWFVHGMGIGESIGAATRRSQNNSFVYTPTNYAPTGVHMGLMGDPSLRLHYNKTIAGLTIVPLANHGAGLTWTAVPGAALAGYYVYRCDSAFGIYTLISPLITGTAFSDTAGTAGKKFYMVRPVILQQSPSGTYFNPTLGTVDSATITYPNGVATVTKEALTVCAYPNPGSANLRLLISTTGAARITVSLSNIAGIRVASGTAVSAGTDPVKISVPTVALPAGIYIISARDGDGAVSTQRWIKR